MLLWVVTLCHILSLLIKIIKQSWNVTLAFATDENHGLDLAELSEYTADLFVEIERRLEELSTG